MLVAVLALGAMLWWWPSYRAWGAAGTGLAVTFMLWLLGAIAARDRTVPGSPVHVVLLAPAVVLLAHLVREAMNRGDNGSSIQPALTFSMIMQLVLLSLGVMLAQGLLPAAARHVWVLGISGAAMVVGAAAAMAWGEASPARTALAMVGFAGVGVWLTMLWGLGEETEPVPAGAAYPVQPRRADCYPPASISPERRLMRWACAIAAIAAVAGLTAMAPSQAVLAGAVAAAALLLAGAAFPRRRLALLASGGALAVGVAGVLSAVQWMRQALFDVIVQTKQAGWFGHGGEAFRHVTAADSGLVVLAMAAGWVGAGCLLAGMAGSLAWLLWHGRHGCGREQARAVLWTMAAGAAGCALLAPGGPFMPAVLLAIALVWGLLPAMLGGAPRRRSGAVVLVVLLGVALLLGMLPNRGLATWTAVAFGLGDTAGHVVAGTALAMVMAWLLGGRRWWLGLAGIVVAAAVGGLGEALQWALRSGTPEMRDWYHHAMGSGGVIVPYLLCLGARRGDSGGRWAT
jgi:hypothetical protein